jgi:hypothetical protein
MNVDLLSNEDEVRKELVIKGKMKAITRAESRPRLTRSTTMQFPHALPMPK